MAAPTFFVTQSISGKSLRIAVIHSCQVWPLVAAVDEGIADGTIRQRAQGFKGQRFFPLMAIKFIAVRLIETGLTGHEDIDVMAASFHFS